MPRLVATDLDGTLVHADGSVSDRTRAVLAALEDRGVPVVFVTARPLRWMDDALADGRRARAGDRLQRRHRVRRGARARVRELRGHRSRGRAGCSREAIYAGVPGASIAIETVAGIRCDPTYDDSLHPGAVRAARRGSLEEIWTDPAVKVLVRHAGHGPGAVPGGGDRRGRALWRSRPGRSTALMEISAPGVTKGSALVALAAELGVEAADVIAFGDMPNDLPMLTWAGTSYAMANAHPDVRSARRPRGAAPRRGRRRGGPRAGLRALTRHRTCRRRRNPRVPWSVEA